MNTSHNFGRDGSRLGNQLFQCGLLFSIREQTGQDFYLPRNGEQFWECFDLPSISRIGESNYLFNERVPPIVFNPEVYKQNIGARFDGYYQSWKYYINCRNKYINFLKFKIEIDCFANRVLDRIRGECQLPIVSVHFRRGDYLLGNSEQLFGNLYKTEYYKKCEEAITEDVVFCCFSDDIEWAKNHIKFNRRTLYLNFNEYQTLCFMTKCDKNIIANSTFSWWGAYLNRSSVVFCPKVWWKNQINMCGSHINDISIACPWWNCVESF